MSAERPRGEVTIISPLKKPGGPTRGRPKTPGSGRKKGTPNKIPTTIKAMVAEALEQAGGVDYLVTQAYLNPNTFLALVGRCMPLQVTDGAGGPQIVVQREVKRTIVSPGSAAAAGSPNMRVERHGGEADDNDE